MVADEALARLGEMARASIEDFTEIKDGIPNALWLDLEKASQRNKLHLIKKFKYSSEGQLEFELHDALSALKTIAKLLGLERSGEAQEQVKMQVEWVPIENGNVEVEETTLD